MNISFEDWKKDVLEYIHGLATKAGKDFNEWDWILGGDEDMRRDGYDQNQSPVEYVDYQIEYAI